MNSKARLHHVAGLFTFILLLFHRLVHLPIEKIIISSHIEVAVA
jgi:nitrate reductase gamma subunit